MPVADASTPTDGGILERDAGETHDAGLREDRDAGRIVDAGPGETDAMVGRVDDVGYISIASGTGQRHEGSLFHLTVELHATAPATPEVMVAETSGACRVELTEILAFVPSLAVGPGVVSARVGTGAWQPLIEGAHYSLEIPAPATGTPVTVRVDLAERGVIEETVTVGAPLPVGSPALTEAPINYRFQHPSGTDLRVGWAPAGRSDLVQLVAVRDVLGVEGGTVGTTVRCDAADAAGGITLPWSIVAAHLDIEGASAPAVWLREVHPARGGGTDGVLVEVTSQETSQIATVGFVAP
jgi:hypothetical protein